VILFSSVNFFSVPGLPYVLAAILLIWIFQPLVTFMHELGHAIPALFLSNGKIVIRLGMNKNFRWKRTLDFGSRLAVILYFRNFRTGSTEFDSQVKWYVRLAILLGGPLVSMFLSLLAGRSLFFPTSELFPWMQVLWVSWFCCNFLTFLRSVIPIRLQPTQNDPLGAPSDGLQIYQVLIKRGQS